MTIRLESEFHEECKARSDKIGQTLAEWIRRAMREKLEREKKEEAAAVDQAPAEVLTPDDVEDMVRAAINKVLAEKGL